MTKWNLAVLVGVILESMPNFMCDQCPLYRTQVDTRVQCETLCRYIRACVAYSFSVTTNQCSVWDSVGPRSGTTISTSATDKKDMCRTNLCSSTEVCIPVTAGTSFRCMKYAPECTCPSPVPHLANASLIALPVMTGNPVRAEYGCQTGFQKVTGSEVTTCQGSAWSDLTLVCQIIRCSHPNFTLPGVSENVTLHDDTYNSTVVYECMDGYIKTGDGVSVCLESATWSLPNITCTTYGQMCGLPNYSSEGLIVNNATYSNTVVYECMDGYSQTGDGVSICLENATWSFPNITCAAHGQMCGLPNFSSHGLSIKVTVHNATYSNTVVCQCMDGYTQTGDGVSICLKNATWSWPNITCTAYGRMCDLPDYSSIGLSAKVTVHNHTYNSTVVYQCMDGYRQTGDGVSVCLGNTTWSWPNITCIAIQCLLPIKTIENTTYSMMSSNYGDIVNYSCAEGYVYQSGVNISMCQKDGTWSDPTISCQAIHCGQPRGNVRYATYMKTSSNYGDIATYSCEEGYKYYDGSNISKCLQDGTWSAPTIRCEVVRCLQQANAVGHAVYTTKSSNYGDIVKYSCANGYKYYSGNDTSVCQKDGMWSKPTIRCGMWEEWAAEVLDFSSQYQETGWYATEIIGKFDVYPQYGDIPGSWAPRSRHCKKKKEWIEVRFNESLYIHRINIYETLQAGLVQKVSVGLPDGRWRAIWRARSVSVIEKSRIFSPKFKPIKYRADRVRILTNCTTATHWVEFDAIKIVGLKTPPETF